MKTQCCDYEPSSGIPYPVFWNPFNGVVQCHNCGTVYVPQKEVLMAYNKGVDRTMKWVSETCKEQIKKLTTLNESLSANTEGD